MVNGWHAQVLIVVGLLCTIIFGGALFMWFQAQNNGVLDGKKKKKVSPSMSGLENAPVSICTVS